ncbi:mce/mlad [Lucifera butyrica]|uniref:Mce/mlad n=1 Tax=Lucifera butyrica TaxID=1351585 RepID=A0A498RGP9_9FIRM|nr:MlaD family protein [Lucifera butyrica]VBB09252.1 mce/mlad [Lucifera butyrica]
MKMSTEARVGAVTLTGLLLLAYMVIHLGGFSLGEKGYPVYAAFKQVNGLKPGNLVRYAGVEVGRVQDVMVSPQGVDVKMLIHPNTKLPTDAKFTINTEGLMGEKFIDIIPPPVVSGVLAPNARVRGEDPQGLDQMIAKADEVLAKLDILMGSFNDIFADEQVKASLKDSAVNAKRITDNLNQLSAVLARMARNNEADVNSMVHNLQAMSGSMRQVAARVDKMLATVDNNGQTAEDLREAIHNLKTTSVRVETMASSLEGVVTDPETAQNIKATLRNAREVSEKANKMLNKVGNVSARTDFEMLYGTGNNKYRSNADVRIQTSPQDFAVVGVSDLGETNKFNFQVGKGDDKWDQRAGIIDGKAGVGVDTKLNDRLQLSLDVYDPNDVRVKLRTKYQLAPDTSLVAETESLNKNPGDNTYIGLSRSF